MDSSKETKKTDEERGFIHNDELDEPLLAAIIDDNQTEKHGSKFFSKENFHSRFVDTSLENPTSDITSDEDISEESSESAAHYTTNLETMIHLLKANVGTGILAMPSAFKNIGLFAGLFSMAFLGILCVHCQHILLACGKEISLRINERTLSYPKVAEYAFKLGPEKCRKFSVLARRIVNLFLIMTQIGFCIVYFVFIASNISKVLSIYCGVQYHVGTVMAFILPFMIVYNFIKNLKTLAPLSMIANILQTVGLIIIFSYICQNLPPISSRVYVANYSTWPLFFGTAIYTFEGIGMVLPIENKMKNPADFRGLSGVLNTTMIMVACLFCAVGFYGYLKVGDDVNASITLNLPQGKILYDSVKIMFAISVFLTYSLMLYVPIEIIWPSISRHIHNQKLNAFANYAFRTFLVLCSFALAEVLPHLDVVISLVGAVGSSGLALIFPPFIEIVMMYPDRYGKFYWILIKDVLLCLFGLFGFCIGTYATISQAIEKGS